MLNFARVVLRTRHKAGRAYFFSYRFFPVFPARFSAFYSC